MNHARTACVHAGSLDDPHTGAVGTPIYQTSTFLLGDAVYSAVAEGRGRETSIYSRYGNPNQWAVQEKLAALEGAESAVVTSSGMAAIASTLFAFLDPGDHVIAGRTLYGGSYTLLQEDLPRASMATSFVDPSDPQAFEDAIRPTTRILFVEALSNPLLELVDLEALADIARRHDLLLIVDATFLTPLGIRPLELDADLVIHSASKYLNGHSDLIAGAVLGKRELIDRVWRRMIHFGGMLDPHACFLLERGLKTLALRMEAHWQGALETAAWLESHPQVRRVCHPLLASSKDRALAERMNVRGSGVVTFFVEGGDEAALALLDAVRLPKVAISLGGVESLISLPFNTSHAPYGEEQRNAIGIMPGCVRLSVGIEDPDDLMADLDQAFSFVVAATLDPAVRI